MVRIQQDDADVYGQQMKQWHHHQECVIKDELLSILTAAFSQISLSIHPTYEHGCCS